MGWGQSADWFLEFVYNLLQTLRTPSIASIVERLRPHLHKDPVTYLPPEVTSEIFSYLTPSMLLQASSVSRPWRERTLDSRLWKRKFHLEGWDLEIEAVRSLEHPPGSPLKTRSRRAETHEDQRRHKRRIRPGNDIDMEMTQEAPREESHGISGRPRNVQRWNKQHGAVEADADSDTIKSALDQEMHDVGGEKLSDIIDQSGVRPSYEGRNEESIRVANSAVTRRASDISMETNPQTPAEREPPLVWYSSVNQPRLNYQQLYKQRRKLEENWNACAYKSFQLPHKDHPEEAHGECVYTIQYIGRHLVSGSRDRTLRKWDLETQRLIGKPMLGHSASVLCLQFDNSKEEDIIMSGSSDTNVLIWRYSTGALLDRIDEAHREPVLNLKFDARFLVTCSKDKTIKIWNRHKLVPGDKDYPKRDMKGGGKCPSYIVDLTTVGTDPFDIHKYLRPDQREPLREYTNLMTLDSHSAAVNAIHIYKDQLVSASGDRYVKVWDIHTGQCTATCRGHQKGIACVQYDGKRIISGSSDNTIRIFDPATQAEVACLQGHTRLVRTIQSAFEDLPGSREELQIEAEEVDRQFFLANDSEEMTSRIRNLPRNPGSSKPEHIMAVGAKLPPGGGGSRWGRIVSGSYDETIIIWRKGPDGRWVPGHRLRQEEALRAAGGPLATRSEAAHSANAPFGTQRHRNVLSNPHHQQTQHNFQSTNQASQSSGSGPSVRSSNDAQISSRTSSLQPTATTSPPSSTQRNLLFQSLSNPAPSSTAATASSLRLPQHQHTTTAPSSSSTGAFQPSTRPGNPPALLNAQNLPSTIPPPLPQSNTQPFSSALRPANPHRPAPPPPQTTTQIPPIPPLDPAMHPHPSLYPQNQTPVPNPRPPQFMHHPRVPGPTVQQPNARVFKLQFDARRIICCSQDPKIVGWDFANGDERIVEASRFFGAPQ